MLIMNPEIEIFENSNLDAKIEAFTIKQGRFEGPYTKILDLIESRKLSISEVSLSQIADEYIAYVKNLQTVDALDMSQFILVASTLMLIKAKSLLPTLSYTEEEKEQVSDLEKKLELYKALQDCEKKIKNIWESNIAFNRKKTVIKEKIFSPGFMFTKENLYTIALATIAKLPNFEKLKNVAVRQMVKLEEVIEKMINRIQDSMTSLKEFAKGVTGDSMNMKEIRKNIVVSFLALLELLKQGVVDAEQEGNDIRILQKSK